MVAIRLPSNGTLKTKEKESGNLTVRAMPFMLNFHTQKSSSQLEERKIFFIRVWMILPVRILNDFFFHA